MKALPIRTLEGFAGERLVPDTTPDGILVQVEGRWWVVVPPTRPLPPGLYLFSLFQPPVQVPYPIKRHHPQPLAVVVGPGPD